MRLISWIIGLPLAIIIIAFAVANRQAAILDFWPLPFTVAVPTFAAVLVPLVLGLVLGGLLVWLQAGHARHDARVSRRRAESLQKEVDKLRGEKTAPAAIAAPAATPAGPGATKP